MASLEEWEARTEFDVGVLVCQYLERHPAPADSEMADRLREIGVTLRDTGDEHLRRLGLRRLQGVLA